VTAGPGTPTVTVVVCTYNRADLLPGCLESLAAQTAAQASFEVIVVNNNSTDATQEIATTFATREPNFRVVVETAQGLSHARNRGCKEAAGAYVGYMDDDAKAEPDWVERAVAIARERRADIFGGPIYPFYLTDKPRWFKDDYEIRRTAEQPTELKEKGFISGSNIFFRRELLEAVGGFDPNLGMQGTQLRYGEETAVIVRVRKTRPEAVIFYHPDLRVRHLVPAAKMRVGYFLRSRFASGRHNRAVFGRDGGRAQAAAGLAGSVAAIAFRLCVGLPLRRRADQPHWQNYVVERIAPLFAKVGIYCGRLCR
jgi:glycosyltransferase involved in cell wall biosynthesis